MTALPEAAYNIPDAGAAWQIRRYTKEYDKGPPRQNGFYVMNSHHTGAVGLSKSDTTRWRNIRQRVHVILMPMTEGGQGFVFRTDFFTKENRGWFRFGIHGSQRGPCHAQIRP